MCRSGFPTQKRELLPSEILIWHTVVVIFYEFKIVQLKSLERLLLATFQLLLHAQSVSLNTRKKMIMSRGETKKKLLACVVCDYFYEIFFSLWVLGAAHGLLLLFTSTLRNFSVPLKFRISFFSSSTRGN